MYCKTTFVGIISLIGVQSHLKSEVKIKRFTYTNEVALILLLYSKSKKGDSENPSFTKTLLKIKALTKGNKVLSITFLTEFGFIVDESLYKLLKISQITFGVFESLLKPTRAFVTVINVCLYNVPKTSKNGFVFQSFLNNATTNLTKASDNLLLANFLICSSK
ncbi:Uncharacterised protein [Chlamydia trachomatis]|nr:Uncharacterised protein [Chlamydia trachomatis]